MRRTLVVLLLLGTACSRGGPAPRSAASARLIGAPLASPTRALTIATPLPTVAPVPPTPPPTPAPTPIPDRTGDFRGLGSWIDVYDYTNDPNTIVPLVRAIAAHGVQVLYLETSRYSAPADIQFPAALGAALDEAKAHGMRVVAWYPPAFADLGLDVRRSVAALRFVSPRGNRFDAFAADIEYETGVPDDAERSRRALDYSQQLRAAAGPSYPMAAIVIAPTSLQRKPDRWPGFPWAGLSPLYDVFMPMNYWTANQRNPAGAQQLTMQNALETRRLSGKPVHIIGGLGEDADEAQVLAYVQAALEAGSIGGGMYDYQTTRPEVWDELQSFKG